MRSTEGRLVAFLCACAACGPGLDGIRGQPPPLFVIHGQVEWDEAMFIESYLQRWEIAEPLSFEELGFSLDKLRVALVWAGQPFYLDICSRTDSPEVSSVCTDPSWFRVGTSVAEGVVDPETLEYEVAIAALPPPRLTAGDSRSRIAFGSVVAFFEVEPIDFGFEEQDPGPEVRFRMGETIVGATFATPPESNQRVVYREGPWPHPNLFYPLPGACDVPPRGVSIVRADASTCELAPISDAMNVPVLGPQAVTHLECSGSDYRVIIPPFDLWLGGGGGDERPGVCIDADTYVIPTTGMCAYVEIYPLAGCYTGETCERLDWDLRDEPPADWPCSEGQ